ncbi:MAG: Ig-like domain-containing protein [Planctomycetes bacterium]|nr:Ig-like domain-containing protein [Planctomycetota bacterium]
MALFRKPRTGLRLLLAGAAILALAPTTFAQGPPRRDRPAPPTVVKTIPARNAQDVPPGPTNIQITFSEPMEQTVCFEPQTTGAFPKVTGKPRWSKDQLTCTIPVLLRPNMSYCIGINRARQKPKEFFQSKSGVLIRPSKLEFQTGAAAPEEPPQTTQPTTTPQKPNAEQPEQAPQKGKPAPAHEAAPISVKENVEALKRLRQALSTRYVRPEGQQVDWQAAIEEYKPKLLLKKSATAFAEGLAELLKQAGDPALTLHAGPITVHTAQYPSISNINVQNLPKIVPGWKRHNGMVATGKFPGDIGYILITSWQQANCDDLEPAFEALDDYRDGSGLIIDIRPNAGGSMKLATWFAGCFVEDSVVYARSIAGGEDKDEKPLTIDRKKGRIRYRGYVAVLMGPQNRGASESFLLMMKQVFGCNLVGAKTAGAAVECEQVDLGNGVTVELPVRKIVTPRGKLIGRNGVEPDKPVQTTKETLANMDPVLEAAVQLLKE